MGIRMCTIRRALPGDADRQFGSRECVSIAEVVVLCVSGPGARCGGAAHPRPAGSWELARRYVGKPWMGASFRYANVDTLLDMSWLPLPRFGLRAVGVATQDPLGVGARPWMGASLRYVNVGSLDMSWLSLPRFESRAAGVVSCLGEVEANGGWRR
jgi:hypothetical protein